MTTGNASASRSAERLRVALDTSFLKLPPSGIGSYVAGFGEALRQHAYEIELVPVVPDWTDRGGSIPVLDRLRDDPRSRRFWWDTVDVALAARKARPALLHLPQFSAPLWTPCPLVVTVHDAIPLLLDEYRASRAMRTNVAIMRRTVRRARAIIAPSHAAATDIAAALSYPMERIHVVPMAASADLAPATDRAALAGRLRDRFGITEDYVLNFGGFDRRKNVPLLVRAFARALPQFGRPVTLVIGGAPHSANPAMFPPVAPVAESLGISDRVMLTGRVSDEERRWLYQGAAACVVPSLYEGFGLPALEAMSCGVPVIAANVTSLPEVVGDAGLLIEPTEDALAGALARLLNDADLQRRLIDAGLERAEYFSWERTARETIAVYREAIPIR
jgi:glycosyltransferase involved in cell wall biosynthesis